MPLKIHFDVNKDWLPYEIDNSKGDKLPNNKAVKLNFNLYLQLMKA
jgi:hypothetical protein